MGGPELVGTMVQFGTAGLIGWMWLSERRSAQATERQLHEAHQRLMQERVALEAILDAVRENTRVLAQVEAAQRSLLGVLGRGAGGRGHERATREAGRAEGTDAA